MKHYSHFYIGGRWVEPTGQGQQTLVNPATEEAFATVALGGKEDVDLAVVAARQAFPAWSLTSPAERILAIDRIIGAYEARLEAFARIIAQETGIPCSASAQVRGPIEHMKVARDLLKTYPFEACMDDTIIRREPIGVCALISPWNWPIQTTVIKFIYALAAGCTVVAKPSANSPLSSLLLAEVVHDAGLPAGVFNLIIGPGRLVGEALASHPDVDMISFTGSTGAGKQVGEAAARTVKRVCLELGGKSANIVLPDAELEKAARWNVQRCFFNAGQSCHAPSRMLVHQSQIEQVIPYLVDEVQKYRLGDPLDPQTTMGPVVSRSQFDSIQGYILTGMEEGGRLITGGPGRPEGLERGYFIRPTVFVDVAPQMTVSREEIFGPVLVVIPYADEDEALRIANDSPYGLGGYVFATDRRKGYAFASGLRAGRISFNGAATNSRTPMGGYKQSGVGRSMGAFGLEEYLEVKSVYGFAGEAAGLPTLHTSNREQ